jgi:hypothetical protein
MGESILRSRGDPYKESNSLDRSSKGNPVKIPELDFGMGTVT